MENVRKKMRSIITFILFSFLFIPDLQASNNPNSQFEYDSINGIGYFDLVMSLNWNPSQAERDGKLKTAFETFAKTVYDATEGRHKIRKIYVYLQGAEKKSCDIYIQNIPGRAHASVNGFNKGGFSLSEYFGPRINMFMYKQGGDERDGDEIGLTMAHEFGHYVYGLFDEYAESSNPLTPPSFPQTYDDECNSIMNDHYKFQDFCEDDMHTLVNAQHRMHQASCWATLVRDTNNDPRGFFYLFYPRRTKYEGLEYPSGGTTTQYGGDDVLEIKYMDESKTQVVLIIDRSGSMSGQKIEDAKSAAKQFVDMLQINDKIALVSYGSSVSIPWPMTEIIGPPPQTQIKATLDNLYASGMTAMGDAMREALNIFLTQADPNLRRVAVLLSNGWHNSGLEHPVNVVPAYILEGIPIFTIALGYGADIDLMEEIANQTGGDYYFSPTSIELQEIYASITQQTTATEQLMGHFSETLTLQESAEQIITVDSTIENITFLISWSSGDTMLLELVTPYGQFITPANVDLFPNVSYATESTYALYRVQNPVIGDWIIKTTATNVTSTGEIFGQVQAVADIHLSASVSSDTINYPEPLGIAAALRKNFFIAEANVFATITTPSGNKIILDLQDNGESPDFSEDDGIYSGVYADYIQNGEYEILINAVNLNLEAAETDRGWLEQGERKTWIPIGEQFIRADKIKVSISGIIEDDHGDIPLKATYIQTDNTPVWGHIEQSGDVDFFKFDATEDNRYTLRTSQLIEPMDTLITLYDQDGSTILRDDDDGGGGASSMIIWKAPTNGVYFVKVEHTSSETGAYQLSIGSTQQWEIIHYTLAIFAGTGGTTDPLPGNHIYEMETEISIRAIPNSGYRFTGWSGDASGTATQITITMDSDKSITANFKAIPPPPKPKGGCFIATATYGSPLHSYVKILRDFRDKYFMPTKLGRMLVGFYYKYSAFFADLIANHKALKIMARFNLLPVIVFSYLMLHFGPIITVVLFVFIFILPILLILFFRKRLKRMEARDLNPGFPKLKDTVERI